MVPQPNSSAENDGNQLPNLRPGDSTPRRVFEAVLQQTVALDASEQGISIAEWKVLVKVARRLRGMEFQFDPVVIELVRATLSSQLKNSGQSAEQFAAVAERVARTLYENPESQERLRSLWARLSVVE